MKRPATSRPFVFINMAMTADGKIATTNRAISSFGSKHDREHLYELRASADAVMNGARTIEINAVTMGNGGARFGKLRRRNGLADHNLRVIVSGSGSIDPGAAIFKSRFSPVLILTTNRATKKLALLRSVADEVILCGELEIDFQFALRQLRKEWGVRRLLCEGGATLNAALFRAELVDELHLTLCPRIIGGRMAPTIADGVNCLRLVNATRLQRLSANKVGDELFVAYRRA